jgi:hypothetical protein
LCSNYGTFRYYMLTIKQDGKMKNNCKRIHILYINGVKRNVMGNTVSLTLVKQDSMQSKTVIKIAEV